MLIMLSEQRQQRFICSLLPSLCSGCMYRELLVVLAIIALLAAGGLALTGQVVQRAEPLRIGINVYPGFTPFLIAQEKGLFAQEGVDAEVVILDLTQFVPTIASDKVQMLAS